MSTLEGAAKGLAKRVPGSRWLHQRLRSGLDQARYLRNFRRFRADSAVNCRSMPVRWADRQPQLGEDTSETPFDKHYVYHIAWAMRVLARLCPAHHVDISSSVYFAAAVSAIVPVAMYDFRPPRLRLDNLSVGAADLVRLDFADASVPSLSCMHVAEHVGLGRYGDPLDAVGDLKAMAELERVLAKDGHLLFVVPVGRPRVMFNAHRIYAYDDVLAGFPRCRLVEFALIPDDDRLGELVIGADPALVAAQSYACGCFLLRKI